MQTDTRLPPGVLMTVFRAGPHTEDGRRWMRVEDERSGDIWDEPCAGWCEIWDMVRGGRHYQHRDGRIALPLDAGRHARDVTPKGAA